MNDPSSVVPRQRHHCAAADVAPIEQAKGMLMLSCRIGEDDAAALLERWSGEWGVSLLAVAATIVKTAATSPADVRDGAVGRV